MKAFLATARGTVAVGLVALLAVAALGWVALISPARADIAAARDAQGTAQDRQRQLTARIALLRSQSGGLDAVHRRAAGLGGIVPKTADQPGFFTQVTAAAHAAGLGADAITVLSPTAPIPVGGTAVPTAGVPAAPTSGAGAAPLSTTLTTALGAGGFAVQAVTLTVEGPPTRIEATLAGLQRMHRAFLVTGVDLALADGVETVTLTGDTFVAPPLPKAPAAPSGS